MVDREGNVLKVPSYSQKAKVGGEEIMASYTDHLVQKGAQLKGGIGVLEAGQALALDSGKLYTRYAGTSDEVQSITYGGSGLVSYTLTYSGQTTAPILVAATAADIQAALEALSNIAPGDVTVTGTAGTGPFTVTFGGALADTNVAQMTSTPTGGSGTVTIATPTAGGTAATNKCVGFLRNSVDTGTVGAPVDVVLAGILKRDKLIGLDAQAISDLNGRIDVIHNYFIF